MDNTPPSEEKSTSPIGPEPVETSSTETSPAEASSTTTETAPRPSTEPAPTEPNTKPPKKSKLSKKAVIIIIISILVVLGLAGGAAAFLLSQNHSDSDPDDLPSDSSTGAISQVSNFDLAFLKDETANQLYSPLSIKYALAMLEAGAAGDSKQQISDAIGDFTPEKYPNNQNMSFANALFVNDKLPSDNIKTSYTTALRDQFGAEVLHVPFSSATPINNWVSDKTFGLISDLISNEDLHPTGAPEQDFVLINALAIDMEWINKIQSLRDDYSVTFTHINYGSYVSPLEFSGFNRLSFNQSSLDVNALHLAATIHKYDILNELGADNIRQTIIDEYTKWLDSEDAEVCARDLEETFPAPEEYVEKYLNELGDGGYKTVKSSTDFSLYDDDDIKAFAKDLRTYDGVTLQYVGIMPKSTSLQDYLKNLTTKKLNDAIDHLKTIALDNFKDGVITDIHANIPIFKFEGELDLVKSLQGLGITDVFSETRSNLSNLSNDPTGLYIGNAIHQATVDFSNDGIKASAATALVGGRGAGGCGFYYDFEVPVETIDLTFDNPYLFLIRDKDSGAIWFIGTVYEPTAYTQPSFQ